MAKPIPEPDYIIIWLDQHIGLLTENKQLKNGVSEQTDPEKILPTSPFEKNINDLIQFKANMEQSFTEIPKNLKEFSDQDACLQCIGESLNANKKIFFITSGSMGRDIAPEIIKKYPSFETIYVFCGYYKAHLDWVDECLDQGVNCIMSDFPTDLLVRLLRDVAECFVSEGDNELNQNEQLAYSAIFYFGWAKLLFHRANNFAMRKIFVRLTYVESRIEFTEESIKKLKSDDENQEPS